MNAESLKGYDIYDVKFSLAWILKDPYIRFLWASIGFQVKLNSEGLYICVTFQYLTC
jgi:hypothetical protein